MPRCSKFLAATAIVVAAAICGPTVASASAQPAVSSTKAAQSSTLPTIVIGSENFTEEIILGNLYADVLQHAGFKTDLRSDLGTRAYVDEALAHKALDLFPDYAGSLLTYLKPKDTAQATQITTDIPALKTALASQGATVLDWAPAIDTNVFAVTKATAAKYHLRTLSDLQPVASELVMGGPIECPAYAYCLLGLEKVYHLHFKSFLSTDEAGPITVADLENGKVQVAELFSTDNAIAENGFVQLVDNKHLEPADHIIPVIRTSFDTPAAAAALNALSAKLSTAQLTDLDTQAGTNHDPAADAAKWLKTEGLT